MNEDELINRFECEIPKKFSFLTEAPFGYVGKEPQRYGEGTHDYISVIRYFGAKSRVDIAYNPIEFSIGVLITLERDDVERRLKKLMLEPCVYFLTNCQLDPIVPQVYYGMTVSQIERVMRVRGEMLIAEKIGSVTVRLSERLKSFHDKIISMSAAQITNFHYWYEKGGGPVSYGIFEKLSEKTR